MYRIRGDGVWSDGNGSVITTHCEDDSSNTVVGDRVFANFNPSTKSLSTKGLLSQRNNDYMKFSWDPMQVVNISRQQKAVCSRAQQRYQGLERYFSRQNHLEAYKQTTMIDKFRQRLVKLNKLRMPTSSKLPVATLRGSPINTTSRVAYRSIGFFPIAKNRSVQIKSGERFDYLNKPIRRVLSNKTQAVNDNEHNYASVNNKNSGYLYSSYEDENLSKSTDLHSLNRQADTKLKINSCQEKDCLYNNCLPRYQCTDKRFQSYEIRQCKNRCNNSVDIGNKSQRLTVSDSELARNNTQLRSFETCADAPRKTVRFMSATAEDNNYTANKTESGRKFNQLVKLAQRVTDKRVA